MRNMMTALAIVASITPALADVSGVWSTQAGCDWRARGNDANFPKDFETISYLTKDGVLGWEWGCDFLSKSENSYGQTVSVASCSAEGDSWPDLILIEPNGAEGWQLVFRNNAIQVDIMDFPVQCKQ